MAIRFIDLFAGIGGFHAAGEAFDWKCVFANEIDPAAAAIYEKNWGITAIGNIHDYTRGKNLKPIPAHDVLFAGFPCQPFSKSGKQLGMEEDRGSLFHDILAILKEHRPALVVLENVRNLTGPRHEHEWKFIVQKLRDLGYRISSKPFVVSPHRIPPGFGGTPQARERVFIVGAFVPPELRKVTDFDEPLEFPTDFERWDPQTWNLARDLPVDRKSKSAFLKYRLNEEEIALLDAWDSLVLNMLDHRNGLRLPGFPLWSDLWGKRPLYKKETGAPEWKKNFESKNRNFYLEHRDVIDSWLSEFPLIRETSPSKRKLEWQAQDLNSLWDGLIHFRPSGIRVKKPTYSPALVAITQTTIFGPAKRRITPTEALRLQGMPDNFDFGNQSDQASYKQLGNGVAVGAVYQTIKAVASRDSNILAKTNPQLLQSIKNAVENPKLSKPANLKAKASNH